MAFDQENCNFSIKDDFNGSIYYAFTQVGPCATQEVEDVP